MTLVVLAAVAAFPSPGWAAQWKLVFEDRFDRQELGKDWMVQRGSAGIRDGRLYMQGTTLLLASQAFAADVRIEFTAEADPSTPPCDLSATLAANPIHGWGHLLAFGGKGNRANQIIGGGVQVVDDSPPFVIEHGKKYRVAAWREGNRLSLSVDGEVVLEAVSDSLLTGPGLDHVGLLTWNGMYVDNVQVYERSVRHPDTPDYPRSLRGSPFRRDGRKLVMVDGAFPTPAVAAALDLFASGSMEEAFDKFGKISDPWISVWGQAWVIGDLAFQESWSARELRDFSESGRLKLAGARNPDAQALGKALEWLNSLQMDKDRGRYAAIRLAGLGEAGNPFYHKALFYQARYLYWEGKEGGFPDQIVSAVAMLNELKQTWPEHSVLRQYTGEKVPWGQDLIADTEKHPQWAAFLHEAYKRQLAIMEHFFKVRQDDKGGLGGGYGDDVELMRTWLPVAAISTGAVEVRQGIARLAEGVWAYELKDGYSPEIGDIEHSAEPSADILPGMMLLEWGNPLWLERNRVSAKTIRERFMGVDEKGYLRFLSAEFGSDGVNTDPRAGGDNGYHARVMKHILWLAWLGDPEAMETYLNWVEGWMQATLEEKDGKPSGMPPHTLWFPSGDMYPPVDAPWWDPHWNYFGDMGGMIQDSFLSAAFVSGQQRFLEPFLRMMELATQGPLLGGSLAPGTPERIWMDLVHQANPSRASVYRLLTGERVFDEYVLRNGDPAQVYRCTYDLERFQRSFEAAAVNNRFNLELETTEVLSTDRAALSNALTVFGAYTGAVQPMHDGMVPTLAVTYDTSSTDFAALVTEAENRRLRIWIYSFEEEELPIDLLLWRLEPGTYRMVQGRLLPGEREGQHRYGWTQSRQVEVQGKGSRAGITVPPGEVWVVDLRLQR